MQQGEQDSVDQKSILAEKEETVLKFWKEKNIFEKALEKSSPKGDFVFFEGPPTANAKPALHHLEARAFKDVLPRYKTMQGYRVPRRAGWDTHGLPVELQIEKKLGLTSKKDIESYGIAKFNKECKDSVFTFIKDWEDFTDRIGYWVDKENAYYTFDPRYMESLWSIMGKVNDRGLLYKDYKVVPWCPRCGTGLSSHELAQGYQDDKDLSVTAKFKVVGEENTYILAWTTTPWTLPGNVALAVGKDIEYLKIKKENQILILAKARLAIVEGEYETVGEVHGSDLVGLSYEPLYPYLKKELEKKGDKKLEKSFKVYSADFVTTTDGTGVVHTAVMYGADDFELGTKIGLPKLHTVDESGHFIKGAEFLEGRFVKDEEVAIDIIKDLAHRGLLFKKEKYDHSYPHCWRCKTPLIYYARDSWYIKMSEIKSDLVKENQGINWEPNHIKDGRFGEWLRELKDWAISRERYWGTPLPIWIAEDGDKIVVDGLPTLRKYIKKSGNKYFVMRHGETDHNLKSVWSYKDEKSDKLTDNGKAQILESAKGLKKENIDIVISSPFFRTHETAKMVARSLGINENQIKTDESIAEWKVGSDFDGKSIESFFKVRNASDDRYNFRSDGGESYIDVIKRAGEFLYKIEREYKGKNILIISHGAVTRALELVSNGIYFRNLFETTRSYTNFKNAECRKINFVPFPHNENYEVDLHRPFVDDVILERDSKEYKRVKEVMDVWFDSGAMPFAQDHYPFEAKKSLFGSKQKLPYPADFISEAIDQTRGWFYTLHAIGSLMGRGKAYKNVICLGHLLDKDGKKMSKSIGNIVEPFSQINKFGVDAVRFWMYSVNQPGDSKNYDEKTVDEVVKKVFNLVNNVYVFYDTYRDKTLEQNTQFNSENVLDKWIYTRLNQLIKTATESLDSYKIFEPTRAIKDFIDDMSTWYLRRSRDRIKDGDTDARQTLYLVLNNLVKVMAPFTPFISEDLWQKLKTNEDAESVHLSDWPSFEKVDTKVVEAMNSVRNICTEGNALRKKNNIPVRQPLNTFTVNVQGLENYYELIKDELNVKNIEVGNEIGLDMNITPELKREGEYRELVRVVQDMRKEKGLSPQDIITLKLPQKYSEILEEFGEDLKKTVGAKEVVLGGEDVIID